MASWVDTAARLAIEAFWTARTGSSGSSQLCAASMRLLHGSWRTRYRYRFRAWASGRACCWASAMGGKVVEVALEIDRRGRREGKDELAYRQVSDWRTAGRAGRLRLQERPRPFSPPPAAVVESVVEGPRRTAKSERLQGFRAIVLKTLPPPIPRTRNLSTSRRHEPLTCNPRTMRNHQLAINNLLSIDRAETGGQSISSSPVLLFV